MYSQIKTNSFDIGLNDFSFNLQLCKFLIVKADSNNQKKESLITDYQTEATRKIINALCNVYIFLVNTKIIAKNLDDKSDVDTLIRILHTMIENDVLFYCPISTYDYKSNIYSLDIFVISELKSKTFSAKYCINIAEFAKKPTEHVNKLAKEVGRIAHADGICNYCKRELAFKEGNKKGSCQDCWELSKIIEEISKEGISHINQGIKRCGDSMEIYDYLKEKIEKIKEQKNLTNCNIKKIDRAKILLRQIYPSISELKPDDKL